MRLPARYRTRSGYGWAALAVAALPATGLAALVAWRVDPIFFLVLLAGSLSLPVLLARWLWPRGRRTGWIMAGRGLLVTGGALFGGGFLAGILLPIFDDAPLQLDAILAAPFVMGAMGLLFGSVVTLGLPWVLGIGVSLLFRD